MTYTTLVSTDLLASHLDQWAIVDCRFDLQREEAGREQYRAGHIPGAVYASLNDDLSATRTGTNGRHPLPSVDALAAAFGRFGIDRATQVVVYDQDAGLFASRLGKVHSCEKGPILSVSRIAFDLFCPVLSAIPKNA